MTPIDRSRAFIRVACMLLILRSNAYADSTSQTFATQLRFTGAAGDAELNCLWVMSVNATFTVTIEFDAGGAPSTARADMHGTHTFESAAGNQCGDRAPLPVGPFSGDATVVGDEIEFIASTADAHLAFVGILSSDRSKITGVADWSHTNLYGFGGMELSLLPVETCDVPDQEESTFFDWNRRNGGLTQALFLVTLRSDTHADFAGRQVEESTPIDDVNFEGDGCWNLASKLPSIKAIPPPFLRVTGTEPRTVSAANDFEDTIGWDEEAVETYMKALKRAGVASCGTAIKQRMAIECSDGHFERYTTNYITITIVAPNHPNESGTVTVGRCSEDDFRLQSLCPPNRTAVRPWFAAKGRNK
jgi:hypothetical protein